MLAVSDVTCRDHDTTRPRRRKECRAGGSARMCDAYDQIVIERSEVATGALCGQAVGSTSTDMVVESRPVTVMRYSTPWWEIGRA